jgi:eukaryotic-like serine/threonine-protein kinase
MPTTVAPIPPNMLCAAELLEGIDLGNGWTVTTKVPRDPTSTGGNFSVSYFVEKLQGKSVRRAFLKALNFRRLAAAPDFARAVQQQTAAFNFERDTLQLCKDKGLRRVATLLDAGEYRMPGNPFPVCFIIFELV